MTTRRRRCVPEFQCPGGVADVDDEWVCFGTAFRGVYFVNGGGVEGVTAQAVDGFGGEGDEVSGFEARGALVQGGCGGRD